MMKIIQFIFSLFGSSMKQKIMDAIQGQLLGKASGGDAGGGMLGGLMKQFQEKGLGNIFNSWVGAGKNEPISPDQLTDAIGPEKMQAMSKKTGLSVDDLAQELAKHLPTAVDKMTPNGKLPT